MFTKKTAAFRFIFYSGFTVLLVGLATLFNREAAGHFLQEWQLWRDPIMAGMLCGLVLSLLGVYILLNRIVFVSLALSQGASFGIFLAFLLGGWVGLNLENSSWPLFLGFLIAIFTAVFFARLRKSIRYPDESLIGLIYIVTSGLIIVIGDRITQGRHNIDNLLFGDAVAVTFEDLLLMAAVALPILFLHFLFRREFLYSSADADFMRIRGINTRRWMVLLYLTLTAAITASLKVLGALPVFALMVLPPFIALKKTKGLRDAFLVSILIGTLLPALGYYFSFLFSFPTGGSLILVALFYTLASALEPALKEKVPLKA
ncbi:MAG: iron chelate uptake ABC transporter family permease subunit [bacterium]